MSGRVRSACQSLTSLSRPISSLATCSAEISSSQTCRQRCQCSLPGLPLGVPSRGYLHSPSSRPKSNRQLPVASRPKMRSSAAPRSQATPRPNLRAGAVKSTTTLEADRRACRDRLSERSSELLSPVREAALDRFFGGGVTFLTSISFSSWDRAPSHHCRLSIS